MLRGVRFGYTPGEPVVGVAAAALAAGRITALIGPNASGKTTLVKLMLGQLRPWEGAVEMEGRAVGSMSEPQRARSIAYVPQRGGSAFAFTVRQVVAMGRFAHRDGEGVEQAIEACDLRAIAHRPFAELSGGQQQRVLVARAMAQLHGEGRVLLADEPASGMDLRHQLRMMKLMGSLSQRGAAVLIVLHDLNLAARYADEVWVMHGGALAAAGPWDAVMRPAALEPVFGVGLQVIGHSRTGRPVLAMEEPATMGAS